MPLLRAMVVRVRSFRSQLQHHTTEYRQCKYRILQPCDIISTGRCRRCGRLLYDSVALTVQAKPTAHQLALSDHQGRIPRALGIRRRVLWSEHLSVSK